MKKDERKLPLKALTFDRSFRSQLKPVAVVQESNPEDTNDLSQEKVVQFCALKLQNRSLLSYVVEKSWGGGMCP